MDSKCTKFLVLFIIFVNSMLFSNEKIDSMRGIWTHRNERNGEFLNKYWSLALEKISESEYLILYSSNAENHKLDISEIGSVISDNLIKIRKDDGDDFYVFLDYERDSVYFLWNHTIPNDVYFDTELKRVTEVYDKELIKTREKLFEEKIKNGFMNSLK